MHSYPCIPNFDFFDTPSFLLSSLHLTSAISTPIYCLGVYCILFKTPEVMRSVKWYLLVQHIWAIVLDYLIGVLVMPYVLFPAVAWIPNGVFTWAGVPAYVQNLLMLVAMCCIGISTISTYENRFYILCEFRKKKSHWTVIRWFWLLGHYLLITVVLTIVALRIPEQSTAKREAFRILQCLPGYIYEAEVFVLSYDMNFVLLATTIGGGIATVEIAFFLVCLSYNAVRQLNRFNISMATYQMQRAFLFALVIQTTIPTFMLILSLAVFEAIVLFKYQNQAAINFGTIFVACHGLVATVVMLSVHRPYRLACRQLIRMELKTVPLHESRKQVKSTIVNS